MGRARVRTWALQDLEPSETYTLWFDSVQRRWEVATHSAPGAPLVTRAPGRADGAARPQRSEERSAARTDGGTGTGRHRW